MALNLDELELSQTGREEAVRRLYSTPLSHDVQESLLQHSIYVDRYLLQLMANTNTLTSLDLSHSFAVDLSVVAITEGLLVNTVLKELILSDNPLTDVSAFFIAESLMRNSTLEVIALERVLFTQKGRDLLVRGLAINQTIREIILDPQPSLSEDESPPSCVTQLRLLSEGIAPRSKQVTPMDVVQWNTYGANVKRAAVGGWLAPENAPSLRLVDNELFDVSAWAAICRPLHKAIYDGFTFNLTGHSTIGDELLPHLCCLLTEQPVQQCTVILNDCGFSPGCVSLFLDVLEHFSLTEFQTSPVKCLQLSDIEEETTGRLEWILSLLQHSHAVRSLLHRIKHARQSVRHVELRDEDCSDTTAALLSEVLHSNETLQSLCLVNGSLSRDGIPSIALCLNGCFALQVLDLSGNEAIGESIAVLTTALASSKLAIIRLVNCGLTNAVSESWKMLLEKCETLTSLDLSHNEKLSSTTGETILQSIENSLSLRDCALSHTAIPPALQEQILAVLVERALDRRVVQLAERCRVNDETLTMIHLNGEESNEVVGARPPRIFDSSLEVLSRSLESNTMLTELDLSHNRLTQDGLAFLFHCILSTKVPITSVNISGNVICRSDEFDEKLFALLQKSPFLVRFSAVGCGFGAPFVHDIAEDMLQMQMTDTLRAVHLAGNGGSLDDMDCISVCSDIQTVSSPVLKVYLAQLWSQLRAAIKAAVRHNWTSALPSRAVVDKVSLQSLVQSENDFLVAIRLIGKAAQHAIREKVGPIGIHRFDFSKSKLSAIVAKAMRATFWSEENSADGVAVTIHSLVGKRVTVEEGSLEVFVDVVERLPNSILHDCDFSSIKGCVSLALVSHLSSMIVLNHQQPDVKKVVLTLRDPKSTLSSIDFSHLTHRHINDDHLEILLDAFDESLSHENGGAASQVLNFNFSHNHLTNRGLKRILQTCMLPQCRVETIMVRNALLTSDKLAEMIIHCCVGPITTVREIDLRDNSIQLSQESLQRVVNAVDATPSMHRIDFDGCGMTDRELEPLILQMDVNRLGLNATLNSVRSNDSSLTALSLAGFPLTPRFISALTEALVQCKNTNLLHLDLSNTQLADGETLFRWLGNEGRTPLETIETNTKKRSVNFLNRKGPVAVASSPKISAHRLLLETLLLDNNLLSDNCLPHLAFAIQHNTSVTTISLTGNSQLTTPGLVEHLGKCLPDGRNELFFSNDVLANLLVDGCELATDLEQSFLLRQIVDRYTLNDVNRRKAKALLLPLLRDDPILHSISLCHSNANDAVCVELASLLANNSVVTMVDLSDNSITDIGAMALSRALFVNRSIRCLLLSRNNIGNTGAVTLMEAATVSPQLQTLRFDGNSEVDEQSHSTLRRLLIQHENVIDIATNGITAESNSTPTEADDTRVDDDCEVARLGMLLNNTHPLVKEIALQQQERIYQSVDVSKSLETTKKPMSNESCRVLCQLLETNPFVASLDLSENNLTFESAHFIGSLMKSSRSLRSLNLTGNPIGDGLMHVALAMTHNPSIVHISTARCGGSAMYHDTIQWMAELNAEVEGLKQEVLRAKETAVGLSDIEVHEIDCAEAYRDPTRHADRKLALNDHSLRVDGPVHRLFRLCVTVQRVDLSRNQISPQGFASMWEHCLQHQKHLVSLNMSYNQLDDNCVTTIVNGSESLPFLRSINLTGNHISNDSVPLIMDLLAKRKYMERFTVEENEAVSTTAKQRVAYMERVNCTTNEESRTQFVQFLANDNSVTVIDLKGYRAEGRWRLSKEYLELCVFALRFLTDHIKGLLLDDCDMDDSLLTTLGQCVSGYEFRSVVKTVSIADNRLEHIEPLMTALLNSSVENVALNQNRMTISSARAIASLVRNSMTLKSLTVSDNLWGRTGNVIIASAASSSASLVALEVDGKEVYIPPRHHVEAR